jgi:hypothetical protein
MHAWGLLDWGALIIGLGLFASGVRAMHKRKVNVPETYEGGKASNIGCLWIALGALFVVSVLFDVTFLKALFKMFLEAAN